MRGGHSVVKGRCWLPCLRLAALQALWRCLHGTPWLPVLQLRLRRGLCRAPLKLLQ